MPARAVPAAGRFGPPPTHLHAVREEIRRLLAARRHPEAAELLVDTAQYARALPEIRLLLRDDLEP